MRLPLLTASLLLFLGLNAQSVFENEVQSFRDHLNAEFKDPEESPMKEADRLKFEGHNFFPMDADYRVTAQFIRATEADTIYIPTSSGKIKLFDRYAKAVFKLKGQQYEMFIYQSHRSRATEKYKNYLFLPFKDYTNGFESYGGGRYIDLLIPEGDSIVIDFNQSYHPLCAYNDGYNCPIPPEENHLATRIEAGIQMLASSEDQTDH